MVTALVGNGIVPAAYIGTPRRLYRKKMSGRFFRRSEIIEHNRYEAPEALGIESRYLLAPALGQI